MRFNCAQRGCQFEAEAAPELCPVCQNPFVPVVDVETLPRTGDGDTLLEPVAGLEYTELAAALATALERVGELEHVLANQQQGLALQIELAEKRNGELDELGRRVDTLEASLRAALEARAAPAADADAPLASLGATGG